MRMNAKELVEQAVYELFDQRDATAVERDWSPDYIEHSIVGAGRLQGLRDFAGTVPPACRHQRVRVLGEQALVVAHVLYDGLGATPIVAFDMWRVGRGK